MKRFILIVLFVSLFLCGCTDYREIERGYLVNAVGICKSNDNTQIYIAAQSSGLAEKSQEQATLTDCGDFISDAFYNLKTHLVKPLYFEQTAAVVFDYTPTETDISFLTENLKLNYGTYVVKSDDIKALFDYDSPSQSLGYDIITLIKNFNKESSAKTHCRLFEILKYNTSLSAVNICNDKLIFEVINQ